MSLRRYDILERLIERFGYRSYLEIGVAGGATFRRLSLADKTGVDPRWRRWSLFDRRIRKIKSDRFFARNSRSFDLVLIDGLHIAEQAWRDIENALACLDPRGTIVTHDCLPTSREMQSVPRSQVLWTGDVWRAFLRASQQPDLSTMVLDTDCGCGVIRRGSDGLGGTPPELDPFDREALPWEMFDREKSRWLRIVPEDQIEDSLRELPT